MKFKHLIIASTILPLAACSSLQSGVRETTLNDGFAEALRGAYIDLADFERSQGDIFDARNYEKKVNELTKGVVPEPEDLAGWEIPAEFETELAAARTSLMDAFTAGARQKAAAEAARAQASFDCWVEQQEENFQPEHIKACKDDFLANLSKVEEAVKPAPVKKVAEQAPVKKVEEVKKPRVIEMPGEYIVFFDFDRDGLTAGSKAVLDDIAKAIKEYNPRQLLINGHTDRAGTVTYNLVLSERRAKQVADYLSSAGVAANLLQVTGYGELQPRVNTEDGVREAENRFVNIVMVK